LKVAQSNLVGVQMESVGVAPQFKYVQLGPACCSKMMKRRPQAIANAVRSSQVQARQAWQPWKSSCGV